MTKRAIIIGLLGAAFINAFCYFHDCIISPGGRLIPHLMPPIVYGVLVFGVLGLNPLLRRLGKKYVLSGSELSVVAALALVACSVPFIGMVHCWPCACMLPHHYNRISPGWQEEKVLELAPKQMLADISQDEGRALSGYVTGMGVGSEHISFSEVPWSAWTRTMAFWVPLVLTITIACLGLAIVIHQQWAHHEQLPYPISQFAHALLPGEDGEESSVLRNRGFMIAAGLVFLIHMVNYAHAWWPRFIIPINLRINFSPLTSVFPQILQGDGRSLFHPRLIFTVVGIAYFFASDVALSLAVVPVVMCFVYGVLTSYGVSVTPGFSLFHNTKVYVYTGGYLGIFLMAIYTGRHYYWNVLRRSINLPSAEKLQPYQVWGMRVFLIGSALFWVQLLIVGLDWPLATLYTGMAVMVFTVVSRAVAETGAFYVGTWIMPGAVLWGFLGARAIGPQALTIMIMVSIVVLVGPGWAPMPFVVQALEMTDMSKVKVPKVAVWSIVTLVLCMAIAIPATIYWQYDRGAMTASSGWARYTPKLPFDQALYMKQHLAAQGLLESSEKVHGFGRFMNLAPNGTFVTAFLIAVVLAIAVSVCRLRFPWWPLHPIVFVFFGSHQAQYLAFSFFLGWLIKHGVNKYGGASAYQRLRPVMIGLIAGEMSAGIVPMIIGVIYYMITGKPPVRCSLIL